MRVAITGASGLVGTALARSLSERGDTVARFVRRPAAAGSDEISWSPESGAVDDTRLEGVDAIVHLAGHSIAGGRWTGRVKREILNSRVSGTRTIASATKRLARPPSVVVSASAVGYYGDRGDEAVEESSPPGAGFLAEVVQAWEAEIDAVPAEKSRVVRLRFGMILSGSGGALPRLLPIFRLGLGGPLGSGTQWMSWITLDDVLGVIRYALDDRELAGVVNVVAPQSVRNAEFTRTLSRVLRRPALIPAPAAALRLLLGEMAQDLLLNSQRVVPRVLLARGFRFAHPDIQMALRAVVGPF